MGSLGSRLGTCLLLLGAAATPHFLITPGQYCEDLKGAYELAHAACVDIEGGYSISVRCVARRRAQCQGDCESLSLRIQHAPCAKRYAAFPLTLNIQNLCYRSGAARRAARQCLQAISHRRDTLCRARRVLTWPRHTRHV